MGAATMGACGRAHPSFGMTQTFREYCKISKKSVSYQKKDGRGHARPSFFWYDNDNDLKVCFLVTRVIIMMFELASALGIANSTNRTLILQENFLELADIFPRVKLLHFLSRRGIERLIEGKKTLRLVENGAGIYSESMLRNYSNQVVLLHAYLQSYKYFQAINISVKQLFTIREDLIRDAQNVLHDAVKDPTNTRDMGDVTFVGVHIRRDDYANKNSQKFGRIVATKLYILRAMEYFSKRYAKVVFIVASDDLNWCRENFPDNMFVIVFSPFTSRELDFTLLTQCNHSIVSTGSFGWWSAYLTGGEVVYQRELSKPGSKKDKRERREDRIPNTWVPISGF